MALISVEEVHSNKQGTFHAALSFNHGPTYPLTLRNPFTSEQEAELEWYFEEHLHFPFTNNIRARNAATSISTYGESLFNQLFANRQAYSAYKEHLQSGLPMLQIEIAGSSNFHSLHWEALKDPDLPVPLSLQATIVRKNLLPSALQAHVRPSPILNLLIVTARPFGKLDMGYRTISRPLVELLRQTDLPVQIEILRPGTYEALDRHLQETTMRNGVGYYQIIHFDVHGGVLSFREFQQAQQANHFLCQGRYGRPDILPYEGEKAFLFFENSRVC